MEISEVKKIINRNKKFVINYNRGSVIVDKSNCELYFSVNDLGVTFKDDFFSLTIKYEQMISIKSKRNFLKKHKQSKAIKWKKKK